jgi:hypothetical protein
MINIRCWFVNNKNLTFFKIALAKQTNCFCQESQSDASDGDGEVETF